VSSALRRELLLLGIELRLLALDELAQRSSCAATVSRVAADADVLSKIRATASPAALRTPRVCIGLLPQRKTMKP